MKRKMLEEKKSVVVSKTCCMQNFNCFTFASCLFDRLSHTFIVTFFNFSNFTGVDESVKVVKIKKVKCFDLKKVDQNTFEKEI